MSYGKTVATFKIVELKDSVHILTVNRGVKVVLLIAQKSLKDVTEKVKTLHKIKNIGRGEGEKPKIPSAFKNMREHRTSLFIFMAERLGDCT